MAKLKNLRRRTRAFNLEHPHFVNQNGELIDFHADKAGKKAALVFQRSVVW